jgi:hypothetical protein
MVIPEKLYSLTGEWAGTKRLWLSQKRQKASLLCRP